MGISVFCGGYPSTGGGVYWAGGFLYIIVFSSGWALHMKADELSMGSYLSRNDGEEGVYQLYDGDGKPSMEYLCFGFSGAVVK